MVSFCTFLIMTEFEHAFTGLRVICIYGFMNCMLILFTHYSTGLFIFLLILL